MMILSSDQCLEGGGNVILAGETESVTENQHQQRTFQVAGGRWLETGRQVTCVQMTYVCHCVSLRQGYISLIISVSRSL